MGDLKGCVLGGNEENKEVFGKKLKGKI